MAGNPQCIELPVFRRNETPKVEADCSKEQASRKLYEDVAPATGMIRGGGHGGSGFFVGDGSRFVTNAHVVSGVRSLMRITAHDGSQYSARIEKMDDIHDLAVMKLENDERNKSVIALGTSNKLAHGEPVYVLGHPSGRPATYVSPGRFDKQSSFREALEEGPDGKAGLEQPGDVSPEVAKDLSRYYGERRLKLSAPIEHGNSGGPVVDGHERLIGIAANISAKEKSYDSWAIPSENLKQLIDGKSNKFEFEYGKVSFADQAPRTAGAITAITAAITMGLPRYGAGLIGGVDLLAAPSRYEAMMHSHNTDERLFNGLGLLSGTGFLAGSILSFAKARRAGYGAIAVGIAGLIGQAFVPTQVELKNIRATDGSDREPLLWGQF